MYMSEEKILEKRIHYFSRIYLVTLEEDSEDDTKVHDIDNEVV